MVNEKEGALRECHKTKEKSFSNVINRYVMGSD